MRFQYQVRENWPPLAWIAETRPGNDVIVVNHGPSVETRAEWFCECVWDGRFAEGGFDQTDIVAGTGGRIRDGSLCLVSSGSSVDRLQYVERDGGIWVSNSIVCLMATLGGSFYPSYPRYPDDIWNSAIRGIHKRRSLRSDLGPVHLVYFNNLRWDGNRIEIEPKPMLARDFSRYEKYRDFITDCLERIGANMQDDERAYSYRFQGTLSAGYDSTAVTALAQPFGLEEAICFERPDGNDAGSALADPLQVRPVIVAVDAWRTLADPEPPFLAGNGYGEEVHYAAAAESLAGRVLLTGIYGDRVWQRDNPYLTPNLRRGGSSGIALTEYRLWSRFIHCPVPFWGARQMREINEISRHPDMEPWEVGGHYTRPIARRIVESAGVARDAFGVAKRFAARWYVVSTDSLTPDCEADFLHYLYDHRQEWVRKLRIPPSPDRKKDNARFEALRSIAEQLVSLPGWYRLGLHQWPVFGSLTTLTTPNPPFPPLLIGARRYYFQWAVERCKARYA